jgi:tRNA threonylcarbamoyl adenosine modification protein YjeE
MDFSVHLPDLAATEHFARRLAPHVRRHDVLALHGPLGAGKTTFARALLQALGVAGEVPSPTFTLLQTYDVADFTIFHFDLYRLKSIMELDELGWDDAIADGLVIVEWPERAEGRMPVGHLILDFTMDEHGQRRCRMTAPANWAERLAAIA